MRPNEKLRGGSGGSSGSGGSTLKRFGKTFLAVELGEDFNLKWL